MAVVEIALGVAEVYWQVNAYNGIQIFYCRDLLPQGRTIKN